MSFHYLPGQFRVPKIPNLTLPDGIWCGADSDAGLYAFDAGGSWGGRIISDALCYSLSIDGSTLTPVFSSINGYVYWSGGGNVYYTQTYGWVYMSGMFPGYEPVEDYEYDEGGMRYTGDSFYSFYSFPSGNGNAVTLSPRGSLNNGGSPKEMTAKWRRWTAKRGEFGEYEPKDGAEGAKWLGLPRFRGDGEYFVRSFAKTNGHFTYGRIRHADGKWVIGEPNSDAGWHEGEEPSRDGAVTFRFTKKEGSEAQGTDIEVSLYDHVKGDEHARAYLGEAAVWR